ncbi:MAG TPA: hypothetical protein VHU41_15230 [Thermoanaerobaculia bacterium]|nr:hypothetical protein [Thermoanaerobaculia bacterium]
MKTLLLALLVATSAAAQPVVGPEVKSATLPAVGDAALLPHGSGYLIAWSEADRINVAHLDATLQATDAPFSVLLPPPSAQPTFVTLASNGSSILVVWKEKPAGYADSTFAATLTEDAKTLLAPPQFLNATPTTPAAGARGDRYELISGDEFRILNEHLETATVDVIPSQLSSALSTAGEVATVTSAVNNRYSCQGGQFRFPTCSTLETFTFTAPSVKKSVDVAFGPTVPDRTPPTHDPFVITDGDHFVGLVVKSSETDVFELRGDRPGMTWTLDPLPLPGIISAAANGSDVLVVWSASAIRGIVLHGDGSTSPPFVIAQYADYNSPKVFVASSDEFIVTYRYSLDAQHSAIAGRVIHVQGGRQRAVR